MQHVIGLLGRPGAGKDTAAQALIDSGWIRLAFAVPLYREVSEAFDVSTDFLGNRDTKETPLKQLALGYCSDGKFVKVALAKLTKCSRLRHAALTYWATGACVPGVSRRRIKSILKVALSPRKVMQLWGTEYKRKLVSDDYWIEQVREAIRAQPTKNFIITDVRFPKEATMVTEDFSGTLVRVVRPSLENLNDIAMQHTSETLMQAYPVDIVLSNADGANGVVSLRKDILSWATARVAALVQCTEAESAA